jgi:hypothetical protein
MPIHDPNDPIADGGGADEQSYLEGGPPTGADNRVGYRRPPQNTVDFSQGKAAIPADVLWASSRSPTLFARSSGRRLR